VSSPSGQPHPAPAGRGRLVVVEDFYGRFGAASLTLLGLWLIVVQTRFRAWAGSTAHRRQATAVAVIFGLPGVLSFLAIVDPDEPAVWKTSFIVGGAIGAVGILLVVVDRAVRPPGAVAVVAFAVAAALQAAIALVAVFANPIGRSSLTLAPIQVERLLFSLLMGAGLVAAWQLLFAEVEEPLDAD
jgi:hypothetical protein